MDVSLFDFALTEERIALRPAVPRDASRLMVVHADGRIEHSHMRDFPGFLRRGDILTVNDTKVIPARLHGLRAARSQDGVAAKIELLLHRRLSPNRFSALSRPARRLAVGDHLTFGALEATVAARGNGGEVEIAFALSGATLDAALAGQGEMPLPPYIAGKRKPDARDVQDYQTIFARADGSVAAPTAGLHFTPELFAALAAKGVTRESVTLHVGLGTFLPVTAQDTQDHRMHAEAALVDAGTAARLNLAREADGRIVAVGTTSLRTLENAADDEGAIKAFTGDTDIFITPGYRFRAVDVLLTNFHLPRSTLFMLVCAFAGTEVMKAAYAEAMREKYRFYSYGDACLLFRPA